MSSDCKQEVPKTLERDDLQNEDEVDTSCGWMSYRPACLSFFNTPKWLLFFLCQFFLCQSITVNGIYSVSISTLEKRFELSSLMMGFLTSVYDIAALFLNFTVAYFGQSRKKSTLLGAGMLTLGFGMLVFIIPHFIVGKYEAGQLSMTVDVAVCPVNNTDYDSMDCSATGGPNVYYGIFVIGMGLMGLGATPMVALGLPYLDENVKPKVSAMYVGIYLISGIVGAGIGFVFAGLFLRVYVDLGVETSLTPQDERWVGNWWFGFLIFGILSILLSFCLFAFPKELPGTKQMRKEIKALDKTEEIPPTGHSSLKQIPSVLWLLLTTPSYFCILLAATATWFIVTALTSFLPKVIEIQYRIPPQTVSFLYGAVIVPAAVLGQLAGSYFVKKFEVGGRSCALMLFVSSALGAICIFFFFVSCSNTDIAGVNIPHAGNSSEMPDLSASCNSECFCGSLEYDPVCGSDGISYFSACHAGCVKFTNKTYSECSCISGVNLTSAGSAVHGLCQANCGVLPGLFMTIFFLYVFISFFGETPVTLATLRCVPFDQRAAALGLQMVLSRAFGSIPGPIVVGMLIDTTCLLWNNRCGEQGSCLEYDNGNLLRIISFVSIISQLIITVFAFLAWRFFPRNSTNKTELAIDSADVNLNTRF